MNDNLREVCAQLLSEIPDSWLQHIKEELDYIIQYEKDAAAYVPPPRRNVEAVTMPISPEYRRAEPIIIGWDD